MKLAFLRQLEALVSGKATQAVAVPPALCRAQAALGQLLEIRGCARLAGEGLRHALRMLELAEKAAANQDPREVVEYFSLLSERHSQAAAEQILRTRCERRIKRATARLDRLRGERATL